ncbi:hypothetical protein [Cytobacillus horneckiae]|uniref:GerMN domain-containing protein n=1 Tax=Cytobacillus horneckiae TaxID=549687 RepID=A0A2N0ZCX6_9BACI|nr:hypothetical protein [Cytobacillus horneckiae]MEC1156581.1 hypothetical protein [Cytobacillus horneckiae]MED2938894.1 hypothetical protein [Cytobacillus horneckiae]PKG27359.1 hypothetical protein CWS20_19570 [Cytobacillus horneckiae]
MRKQDWSDNHLEDLLRQMPKVEDLREKHEIYQQVSMKMNKRKQRKWIIPSAATAAALLLIFILVPSMIDWQESADSSIESQENGSGNSRNDEVVLQQSNSNNNKEEPASSAAEDNHEEEKYIEEENDAEEQTEVINDKAEDGQQQDDFSNEAKYAAVNYETTAVYDEEVGDQEVLTYSIPDTESQNFIPVSIIVQEEPGKSRIDLFIDHIDHLKEKEWGLSDFNPFNAAFKFSNSDRVLHMDFPKEANITSSANTMMLTAALNDMMYNYDISEIAFSTAGEPGLYYGNEGFRETFMPEEEPGNYAYYFYYPEESNAKPFIVPYRKKLNSIKDAFAAMKTNIADNRLQASISEDIEFEAKEVSDEQLVIEFINDGDMGNDEKTLHTIEAILLTAKEFDYTEVKMENVEIDQVGNFDLSDELKVPVAANKRTIN